MNTFRNSLEESRTLLEQTDRARRQNEQELADTNEQLNDLNGLNASLLSVVKKLHGEISELKVSIFYYQFAPAEKSLF